MVTTHCRTGGGLNSSSGGELKLYLKGKRNTYSNAKSLFIPHFNTFFITNIVQDS